MCHFEVVLNGRTLAIEQFFAVEYCRCVIWDPENVTCDLKISQDSNSFGVQTCCRDARCSDVGSGATGMQQPTGPSSLRSTQILAYVVQISVQNTEWQGTVDSIHLRSLVIAYDDMPVVFERNPGVYVHVSHCHLTQYTITHNPL